MPMMTQFTNLLYELNAETGILTIIVNRPAKLNALNSLTLEEIGQATQLALSDPAVRGIVFSGAGTKAFIAGADIGEFADLNESEALEFSRKGQATLQAIENSPKPVVAAVNGFALGGGCELAMACHLRVASPNAVFGQPEVKLGIIPGYGGTQRLIQLIGKGKALEMMLTADQMSASEALQNGLVNHIVSQDKLLEFCHELLLRILSHAPIAINQVIRIVENFFVPEIEGYLDEAKGFAKCCATEDFREGVDAFMNKRRPLFKGN
jgi:enoyl-CoA hydratase